MLPSCSLPSPPNSSQPAPMLMQSPCSAHPSVELHLHQPPRVVDHAQTAQAVDQGEAARARQPCGGPHPMGPWEVRRWNNTGSVPGIWEAGMRRVRFPWFADLVTRSRLQSCTRARG